MLQEKAPFLGGEGGKRGPRSGHVLGHGSARAFSTLRRRKTPGPRSSAGHGGPWPQATGRSVTENRTPRTRRSPRRPDAPAWVISVVNRFRKMGMKQSKKKPKQTKNNKKTTLLLCCTFMNTDIYTGERRGRRGGRGGDETRFPEQRRPAVHGRSPSSGRWFLWGARQRRL